MRALALIGLPMHLGYLVVFVLVGVESAGVPVPGETALITAGVLAQHSPFPQACRARCGEQPGHRAAEVILGLGLLAAARRSPSTDSDASMALP